MIANKPLALITGVGPRTGAALVRRFAEGGYRVAMLARDTERLAQLAQEIPDTLAFGWRSNSVLVAVAGLRVATFSGAVPARRYRPTGADRHDWVPSPAPTARWRSTPRFICPAVAVSPVIGCLYSFFGAAPAILMAGMGLVNPVAIAIVLEPFGDRAGMASALLGFLQMSFAAIGTALIGALPMGPATADTWLVFGGTALAAVAFLPALRIGAVLVVEDRRAGG